MKPILLIMFILLSLKAFGTPHGISTTIMVPQAGVILATANKGRRLIIVQNVNGAGTVAVKLDSLPANDDDGYQLGTRERIILEITNAVYAKSSQPSGDTVSIIEILE